MAAADPLATATELLPRTGRSGTGPVTVGDAVEAFLSSPRCHESEHTARAYGLCRWPKSLHR
jgi:hypothetical protein